MRPVAALASAISLIAAAAIPALALESPPPLGTGTRIEAQQLTVASELAVAAPTRDSYLVTTSTADSQPFEHVASTFVNNPNAAIQWPFTRGVPISSGFGYRSCAGCSSYHQAVDFTPGEGTPIQAIADGVVIETGGPYGSLGVYARIEHIVDGQRIVSLYAHMLEGSSPLVVGQSISVAQLVGQVGNTGQSTGAHLHFGLFVNGTDAIDPYQWLSENAGR